MNIAITRSVDFDGDVLWVCRSEENRRCTQLYLGKDVNGAIQAAVNAGLSQKEAADKARAELERTERARPVDTISA